MPTRYFDTIGIIVIIVIIINIIVINHMLAYPYTMVFHPKFQQQQQKKVPVYAGRELILR